MIFVLAHYWPYLLVALVAGMGVGWWGQAAVARRARSEAASETRAMPGDPGREPEAWR